MQKYHDKSLYCIESGLNNKDIKKKNNLTYSETILLDRLNISIGDEVSLNQLINLKTFSTGNSNSNIIPPTCKEGVKLTSKEQNILVGLYTKTNDTGVFLTILDFLIPTLTITAMYYRRSFSKCYTVYDAVMGFIAKLPNVLGSYTASKGNTLKPYILTCFKNYIIDLLRKVNTADTPFSYMDNKDADRVTKLDYLRDLHAKRYGRPEIFSNPEETVLANMYVEEVLQVYKKTAKSKKYKLAELLLKHGISRPDLIKNHGSNKAQMHRIVKDLVQIHNYLVAIEEEEATNRG